MSRHFPLLDVARGLAALGIVAYHIDSRMLLWYWGSMDFFFVMSGFLITKTMVELSGYDSRRLKFFVWRATRLLPGLLVTFIGTAALNFILLRIGEGVPWPSFWPYLFFLQNLDLMFVGTAIFGRIHHLLHLWSLIVEEHFYLLWGSMGWIVIAMFATSRSVRPVVLGGVLLLVASLWFRFEHQDLPFINLFSRADGFVMGCLLGMFGFAGRRLVLPRMARACWVVLLTLSFGRLSQLVMMAYSDDALTLVDDLAWIDVTCFSIVSTQLVLSLSRVEVSAQTKKKLLFRFPEWVGKISYELYLVHIPVLYYISITFSRYYTLNPIETLAIAMPVCLGLAHFIHRYGTVPAMSGRMRIVAALRGNPEKVTAAC